MLRRKSNRDDDRLFKFEFEFEQTDFETEVAQLADSNHDTSNVPARPQPRQTPPPVGSHDPAPPPTQPPMLTSDPAAGAADETLPAEPETDASDPAAGAADEALPAEPETDTDISPGAGTELAIPLSTPLPPQNPPLPAHLTQTSAAGHRRLSLRWPRRKHRPAGEHPAEPLVRVADDKPDSLLSAFRRRHDQTPADPDGARVVAGVKITDPGVPRSMDSLREAQPEPEPPAETAAGGASQADDTGGSAPQTTLPMPDMDLDTFSSPPPPTQPAERSPILRLFRRANGNRPRKHRKVKVDEHGRARSLADRFRRNREPEPQVLVDRDGNIIDPETLASRRDTPAPQPAGSQPPSPKTTAISEPSAEAPVKGAKRQKFAWLRRRQPVVGLHIGGSTVRAVIIQHGNVKLSADVPLPPGTIVDGVLQHPKSLTQALQRLWKQEKIKTKLVNFSFVNRHVAVKTVTLPAAARPEDLELAIAHKADTELAPMNTTNSVVDYVELTRSGKVITYLLAAAENRMVSRFVQAVEAANLIAVSCEIAPLAAIRAMRISRDPYGAQMVIDIGAETTTVVAASGPDVFFLRSINLGGNDFTAAVAERTGEDFPAAEQLKRRVGLGLSPTDPAMASDPRLEVVQDALLSVADRLTQELASTLAYYHSQDERRVRGVILTGGGSAMQGLAGEIGSALSLPVQGHADPIPQLDPMPRQDMFVAAGLALGHTMSLLPTGATRSRWNITLPGTRTQSRLLRKPRTPSTLPGRKAPVSPAVLAVVVFALTVSGASIHSKNIREDVDRLTEQLTLSQARDTNVLPPQFSTRIDSPEQVVLTRLIIGTYTPAVASAAEQLKAAGVMEGSLHAQHQQMIVKARAASPAGVTQLTAGLEQIPGGKLIIRRPSDGTEADVIVGIKRPLPEVSR